MSNTKKILVIGSSNTDMTIKSKYLPAHGETILGGNFVIGQGGKGANQAVAAKRLGGDVEFICKVGHDIFGDNSIKEYQREGIAVDNILYSEKPSGIALILVDENGENCISVAPGANGDLSVGDIDKVADIIRGSDFLILQLEIPMESVMRAAQIASEAGVYVILNPAPACELPCDIFKYISLLTPNQTETRILTGVDVKDEKSREEAVRILSDKGVGNVVITLGSNGSMVYSNNKGTLVPAIKVDAVDATAAGDTFCGAICVALANGEDLLSAVKFATKASSITVQKVGAQNSIPDKDELEEVII